MASLELRNDTYRVVFLFRGRKYSYSLKTRNHADAQALAGGVEKTLMRLAQNLLLVPEGVDIVTFVKNDGNLPEPTPAAPPPLNFAHFKERYLETHRHGAMEANSLATVTMHLGHFERTLGARFAMAALTLSHLQEHVNNRARKKYRGKKLSPVTLRKEMASFRAAWNWGAHTGLVKGPFPSKGLVYPKAEEKPPFMTWQEIERKITSRMTEAELSELWDCLYLTGPELEVLLTYVKEHAAHGWVYPAVAFAAHTGARRSELLRVLVADVDFQSSTALVREKKRSRKQRTTRRVPLSPLLSSVLKGWLEAHPGGEYLFCHAGLVARSKKRSQTTGHRGEKARATTQKGRLAGVGPRPPAAAAALTKDEAHDHLKRTLAGSKWAVLRGYHVFRHSFISLAASRGVDQRLIDEWVGHQTEEQRRRYRHLLPSVQQQALHSMFGQ